MQANISLMLKNIGVFRNIKFFFNGKFFWKLSRLLPTDIFFKRDVKSFNNKAPLCRVNKPIVQEQVFCFILLLEKRSVKKLSFYLFSYYLRHINTQFYYFSLDFFPVLCVLSQLYTSPLKYPPFPFFDLLLQAMCI